MTKIKIRSKQPSERFLSSIRDMLGKGKDFLSSVDQVYKIGFEEGFTRQEIAEIVRPMAREMGLNKDQIYYLTHREQHLEVVKSRQLEQQESRKFTTIGFNPTDPERVGEGTTWVNIDEIKIGKRIRTDPQINSDITASIATNGLIEPILVTKDKRLILGYRRLLTCKALNWKKIPVNVSDHVYENDNEIMRVEAIDDYFWKPLEIMEMRNLQKQIEQETGRLLPVDYDKHARLLENYAYMHHEGDDMTDYYKYSQTVRNEVKLIENEYEDDEEAEEL
jgi:ParB-like nuclease domain